DLSNAIFRGNQMQTYIEMRAIAEKLNSIHTRLPLSPLASLAQIHGVDSEISLQDGWKNLFMVEFDSTGYYLISYGACGKADFEKLTDYTPDTINNFESDIVVRNYQFYRWPEGLAPGSMSYSVKQIR